MKARLRRYSPLYYGGPRAAEMVVLRLTVTGMVQGVGFRWFTREAARRLGVAGWVRNSQDGSVEVAVEGEDALVERFIADLERGPSGARVERVSRMPAAEVEPLPRPFVIRERR